MSSTRTLTALALAAAVASAVPAAAASRAVRPRAASPAGAPSTVSQALTWLAMFWGGGPLRSSAAADQAKPGSDPNTQPAATATCPIHLPSGGGLDPNG